MPVWTYVMTTKPLGGRLELAVTFQGAVSDTDLADNHYRIVGGDRLMWSGRATTWERDPRQSCTCADSGHHGGLSAIGGRSSSSTYGPACLATRCTACRRSANCRRASGWPAGFGGHGINTTAMAGDIIARAITEGDDTWRRFVPFELVWSGGAIGRAAAQVHYWWYRLNERSKAKQARRREAEYRRIEGNAPLAV